MPMEDILLLLVLLGATTQGTCICPQATYRVLPDATDVGTSYELIGDARAVHVRSQCALYCQQTPGCKHFVLCSTSSATTLTMAASECVLMRDSQTAGTTQSPHNASLCVMFTEQSITGPSDVKDNDTTGSTPQPSLTTTEYSPFSAFFSAFLNDGSSTTFWDDLNTLPSQSVAFLIAECMVNVAADFNAVHLCRLERDGRVLDIPWYRNQVIVQVRSPGGCGCQDFNRSWSEYSAGFGSVQSGCFWLGNSNITYLTSNVDMEWDLGVVLTNTTSDHHSQLVWYDTFTLGSADDRFPLHYKSYQWGGVGSSSDYVAMDGFGGNQQDNDVHDKQFYTYDSDDVTSCASKHGAGWWYNTKCSHGNLNHVDLPTWPDGTGHEVDYKASFISLQLKFFGSSSGNGNGGK